MDFQDKNLENENNNSFDNSNSLDFEDKNFENMNDNCFDNSNSDDNEYKPNDNVPMSGNIKGLMVILGLAIGATIIMNGKDIHDMMYALIDNSEAFEENGIMKYVTMIAVGEIVYALGHCAACGISIYALAKRQRDGLLLAVLVFASAILSNLFSLVLGFDTANIRSIILAFIFIVIIFTSKDIKTWLPLKIWNYKSKRALACFTLLVVGFVITALATKFFFAAVATLNAAN